jgi:hypothetical protein
MTTQTGDAMKNESGAVGAKKAAALAKLVESGAMGVVPFGALAMRFDCEASEVQDQLDNFRDNAEALAVEAGLSGQEITDAYAAGYAAELSARRACGRSVR